ncbi:MAG: tRNA uridine-5-carboxymethylaminomethyl(34) synthesis enzyme MnmG, partial [Clostridia bacterium]|nr:tRNA uridine-5-carboxymethylaminomethyl(34) synthesis enzyme MnmG [Clostridia bacterium]
MNELEFDIAVIGAGHAGIEAALASARLGMRTAVFTLNMDLVGNMPCNPSIGGTGKGHLVYEIDALGGEMARAADEVMLQSRMLNSSKGPAVHSLRMQADRVKYRNYMKNALENTQGLLLVQAEVTGILTDENGKVRGVKTAFGMEYAAKAVIIASGTSLGGKIIVGEESYASGPDNTLPATRLTADLIAHGVKIVRFKTGTPPRVHSDSLDYDGMELQEGDENPYHFTAEGETPNTKSCYITYTNQTTHDIIRANLHRSPLFGGVIKGTGPRYCPSIEDKVVRFSDKERHQIFVEPMGSDTKEMYLQGLSSSLPEDVQLDFIHSIEGLEDAQVTRPAYAVEYDYMDPIQLKPSLESKMLENLFVAGQ